MKKVAVILSGCGVFDGSEIHETVLALQAIEDQGATWHCFAPNIEQHHVINHANGEVSEETRNVLVESARIARGEVQDVATLDANDFDALVVPGGFGAAKNFTDFAFRGAECSINTHVASACRAFANQKKPAAYLCIAPILLPLIYPQGVKGTIGQDLETEQAFNALGGEHIRCNVDNYVFDEQNNLLSTPAYMLATSITEAASGIRPTIKKLLEL